MQDGFNGNCKNNRGDLEAFSVTKSAIKEENSISVFPLVFFRIKQFFFILYLRETVLRMEIILRFIHSSRMYCEMNFIVGLVYLSIIMNNDDDHSLRLEK